MDHLSPEADVFCTLLITTPFSPPPPYTSCATLAPNGQCTATSNTKCASCPEGVSGSACDMTTIKYTLNADYNSFTDADGEAFAKQMATILDVDPADSMLRGGRARLRERGGNLAVQRPLYNNSTSSLRFCIDSYHLIPELVYTPSYACVFGFRDRPATAVFSHIALSTNPAQSCTRARRPAVLL